MLSDSGQRKARGISPGVKAIEKALSFRSGLSLEAPSGFEPENRGFAVPCLTTWLWRRRRFASSGYNLGPAGWAKISTFRSNLLSKLNLDSILFGRGRWISICSSGSNHAPAGVGHDFHLPQYAPLKTESQFNFVWKRKMDFNNNIAAKTSGCSLPSRSRTEL